MCPSRLRLKSNYEISSKDKLNYQDQMVNRNLIVVTDSTHKECPGCKRWLTKENISKHRKKCKEYLELPQALTTQDLKRQLDTKIQQLDDMEHRLAISQQQVIIQSETIALKDQENARLLSLITTNITNNDRSTNINNNITINNITKIDPNDLRADLANGFDHHQIFSSFKNVKI